MNALALSADARPRIGLIAGWGRYPFQIASALESRGYEVHCLGIAGHADRTLARHCSNFQIVGLTQMGRHVRYFRKHKIQVATMAGKIHKVLFFQKKFWRNNIPDWTCFRTFFPHFITGKENRNDDTLLTAVVDGFAKYGITMTAATELVPEILIKEGQLCGAGLTRNERLDIEYGWKLAKEMGRLDIGQSIAVKGQAVLAVEAVEGTDQCIRRAGLLCSKGGFVVIKVAKPQQDMRFDVPTIGVGTIQSMLQAGGKLLAVEADRTVIVDQPQVIRFAKQHGIKVVAIRDDMIAAKLSEVA